MQPLKLTDTKYSYADYLHWDDDQRWEVIDGVPYAMAAPNRRHQEISMNLSVVLHHYFKSKKCRVYSAPFDVRLSEENAGDEEVQTIVQPDISVFCNAKKLDLRGAKGVPDLALEILSPSTIVHDLNVKLLLYQKFKMKEYWIVDPEMETVNVYRLDSTGRYEIAGKYKKKDRIKSVLFSDLTIGGSIIFA